MVRRLGLGKNNHLSYASLALNPRYATSSSWFMYVLLSTTLLSISLWKMYLLVFYSEWKKKSVVIDKKLFLCFVQISQKRSKWDWKFIWPKYKPRRGHTHIRESKSNDHWEQWSHKRSWKSRSIETLLSSPSSFSQPGPTRDLLTLKKKNTREGRCYHKTRNHKLHYTIVQPYDRNTGSIEDNQWPLRVMNTHAQTKMVEAPPTSPRIQDSIGQPGPLTTLI